VAGTCECGNKLSKFHFLNILIIFNISNIDKEINKELPEDDLIQDPNMLE
jgi:hypothetical protein